MSLDQIGKTSWVGAHHLFKRGVRMSIVGFLKEHLGFTHLSNLVTSLQDDKRRHRPHAVTSCDRLNPVNIDFLSYKYH